MSHDDALKRAGNVFMWAIDTGGQHPDATPEGAAEQIIAMYLRERDCAVAAALLADFPEKRR